MSQCRECHNRMLVKSSVSLFVKFKIASKFLYLFVYVQYFYNKIIVLLVLWWCYPTFLSGVVGGMRAEIHFVSPNAHRLVLVWSCLQYDPIMLSLYSNWCNTYGSWATKQLCLVSLFLTTTMTAQFLHHIATIQLQQSMLSKRKRKSPCSWQFRRNVNHTHC